MDSQNWWILAAGIIVGLVLGITLRALLARALLIKFRRDVQKLNSGDYTSLLKSYRKDAVLHFNDGDHRWAGEHRGRVAIERFLQDFVKVGIQGHINEVFFGGPPWRMTLLAQFDDSAEGPGGTQIYHNSTVLLVRASWGRIYEQSDFYEDTNRILALEKHLNELGIEPVGR